jgi:hypothetical protein
MPVSRAQTTNDYESDLGEFERMAEPRPVPAHFGEINITAPFDPHRYFTMLRRSVHILIFGGTTNRALWKLVAGTGQARCISADSTKRTRGRTRKTKTLAKLIFIFPRLPRQNLLEILSTTLVVKRSTSRPVRDGFSL